VLIASGAALIATSFVPLWATYRVPGLGIVAPRTFHQNAWTAYGVTMQLALLLAIAAVAFTIVLLIGHRVGIADPELVLLGLCGSATLLLLWQVVVGPEGSSDPNGYGIERGILVFTGAALAACMTYGSEVVRRETGRTGRGRR
jgi:hypothetical protein